MNDAKAKDKDPILDQRFFELLYPIIHPNISADVLKHAFEQDMVKHRLYGIGKLLEAAISERKGLQRQDTEGRDFVDGSDAKSASVRWSSKGTAYSAPIHDTSNKKGLLRCVIYERLLNEFYYFLIPPRAYADIPKSSNIEIPFNLDGTPRRESTKTRNVNWWTFEVPNFDGILEDTIIEFEFVKERKLRLDQERVAAREARMAARALRKRSIPLPFEDCGPLTKNPPSLQIPIPCSSVNEWFGNQVVPGILPTSLFEIS